MKLVTGLSLVVLAIAGCRQDMYNQPRTKPYREINLFADGSTARPIPGHTVQYHLAPQNEAFYTGASNGTLLPRLPMQLTPELLQLGRERYEIYCAVCHGATGEGNGEIVLRGFPAPPTYHSDRLRNAPIGHFYDVITSGYGVMYAYASRVDPRDRWAIATYIRALQLSQHAAATDLASSEQKVLEQSQ